MSRPDPIVARKRQLAAIHAGAKQLGYDREMYEALIERVSAEHGSRLICTSSRDLDDKQRAAVLDEMRRLGAGKPSSPTRRGRVRAGQYPGKPANFNQLPAQIEKIEAQLADMGLTWSYADGIAKRMFKIPFVAWCRKVDQLIAILSALHAEQEKRDCNESIDRLRAELGMPEAEFVRMTARLPKGWRRNRDRLKIVVDHLAARLLQKQEQESADASAAS